MPAPTIRMPGLFMDNLASIMADMLAKLIVANRDS